VVDNLARAGDVPEEVVAPIRDPDETLAEISHQVAEILPGAAIGRQMLFRYSLIWRKPES
jgi:hypothetical protein